ncbi:hypothetical protein BIV60_25610 [Bacillus sp. MUM 116]|nr:hypothetical protein BIV60_25610 [Bacillus sp. MUM 116]
MSGRKFIYKVNLAHIEIKKFIKETETIKKFSSKKKKKITPFLENLNFFRLLKVIFLIFLSLYNLHTKE